MPTSPEDERSATVLLITDVPWIHKALREALGLMQVEQGASGVEYDTGTLIGKDTLWKVLLASDRLTKGDVLLRDSAPNLVLYLQREVVGWRGSSDAHLACTPVVEAGQFALDTTLGVSFDMSSVVAGYLRRLDRAIVRGVLERVSLDNFPLLLPGRLWPAFDMNARIQQSRWLAVAVRFGKAGAEDAGERLQPRLAQFFQVLLDLVPGSTPSKSVDPIAPSPPPPALIPVLGTLASVELSAIRMFEQVSWGPVVSQPGWHVVLGDNASGKTSLLRALALALLPRAERDALRQDWTSWLRHDTPRGHIAVTVGAESTTPHTLTLSLERAAAGSAGSQTVVDVRSSEKLQYNGFLAGYGPFRRFTGGDPEWLNTFRAHPRTQRVITLFEERAALSDALEWIKDLWVRAETVKPPPPERAFLKQLLRFINDTGFLPPGVTLQEPNADGVGCQDANGRRVLVIELSDGYRAALSLALDLLRHLAVEHGVANVFAGGKGKALTVRAEGVVLIDEPDAHLHPTWQQRLGGWFKQFFPRMQFVVTTHSPIVCQAADSVLLLPAPGQDAPARMATPAELDRLRYGDVLDAFATDFFGHRVTRSQAGREKLDRLAALNLKAVQAGLDEAEKAEQETLRAELGTAGEAPGEGQPS